MHFILVLIIARKPHQMQGFLSNNQNHKEWSRSCASSLRLMVWLLFALDSMNLSQSNTLSIVTYLSRKKKNCLNLLDIRLELGGGSVAETKRKFIRENLMLNLRWYRVTLGCGKNFSKSTNTSSAESCRGLCLAWCSRKHCSKQTVAFQVMWIGHGGGRCRQNAE